MLKRRQTAGVSERSSNTAQAPIRAAVNDSKRMGNMPGISDPLPFLGAPFLLKAITFVMLGGAAAPVIHAQFEDGGVRITGQIEQFWESESGTNSASNRLLTTFVCTLHNGSWWIDLQWPSGTSQRWQFDGTNLYQMIVVRSTEITLLGGRSRGGSEKHSVTNKAVGNDREVSSVHVWNGMGGCPLDEYHINIPWLAFCSGAYLKLPQRIIPLPTVDARHSPDALAYADQTATYPDELGLPKSVRLVADDKQFQESVLHGVFKGKRDVDLWRKGSSGFKWAMSDGALRFQYEVAAFTNTPLGAIPTEFVWTAYRCDGPEPRIQVHGRGIVSQISPSPSPGPLFTPGTGTTVVDWRLNDAQRGMKGIVYRTEGHTAPATNDPIVQEALERKKRQLDASPAFPKRWTAPAFIIVSMSVMVLLLWKFKTIENTH